MNLRLSLTLSACGLVAAGAGCTAPSTVSRAQSLEQAFAAEQGVVPAGRRQMIDPSMSGYPGMSGYPVSTTPVTYYGYGPTTEREMYRQMHQQQSQMDREQKQDARFVSRGILPPQGSPYRDASLRYRTLDGGTGAPCRTVDGVQVYDGMGCPTGRCGTCPHGYPINGTDFAPGGCPFCGADYIACQPHHFHSFSYHVPRNLSWPSPNAIGGAVVYPYYTHKGPSDFFRDDERTDETY